MHEISRRTVSVADGLELYVAPNVFVANADGDVLLAGTPNYLFGSRDDGTEFLVKRDSVLGAVLKADGTVRVVPAPADPQLLGGMSAASRDDGGWDVVFAQFATPARAEDRAAWDSVTRVWHGVYDGTEWVSLEELPRPAELVLYARGAAPLARHGDALAWALGGRTPSHAQPTVVWERRDGRWTHQVLPGAGGAYRALGYIDSTRLMLAIVNGDTMLPAPSTDANSLFLWSRDPTWRPLRRVVLGSRDGPAYHPVFATWSGGLAMTWTAEAADGEQLHALLNVLDEETDRVVIDSSMAGMSVFAAFGGADGELFWLTQHQAAAMGVSHLRLASVASDGGFGMAQVPYPFLASFGGAPVGKADLLLAGARASPAGETIQSLVIRARVRCQVTRP